MAEYEVRRSHRRRRTMSVFREAGQLVVVVPGAMTRADEHRLVPDLVSRYLQGEAGRRLPAADADLTARAERLFAAHLAAANDGVTPAFAVSWSSRQQQRWGSCTTATGEIRISERLRTLPDWVGDYVLVHELTHLLERTHSDRFHRLVAGFPLAERARGYLEGWSAAVGEAAGDY